MWDHIKLVQFFKSLFILKYKVKVIKVFVYFQKAYYAFFGQDLFTGRVGEGKKIYLMLSTDYSNLGDHAMTYAHKKYLLEAYPDHEFVEVLVSDTYKYMNSIKKNLTTEDIFTLKGGGNIGVEYFREELYRRDIISTFNRNKVVVFPQTVYFPDTALGEKEKFNTIKCFKSNKNLCLITRDLISYNLMKPHIPNNVFLTPDIVHSLPNISFRNINRAGVLTALRDDVEGVYSSADKKSLINKLKRIFTTIKISDTTTDYPISLDMREDELQKIWKQFCEAELVITDRLHGMIFAVLTNTPCIVLRTYNYKLTAQYEWVRNLAHIRMIDYDINNIEAEIKNIMLSKIDDRSRFMSFYNKAILNQDQEDFDDIFNSTFEKQASIK